MDITVNSASDERALRKDLVLSKIDERLERSLMRINQQQNIYNDPIVEENENLMFTQRPFDPFFNSYDNANMVMRNG